MKVGDLVKEKYVTERVGVITAILTRHCGKLLPKRIRVVYTTGEIDEGYSYHFWEVSCK